MRRIGWLLGVILLVGGLWWWAPWKGDAAPPPETTVVGRGSLRVEVSALGTLQPLQFVDVGTQVTGQLRKLHVVIGQAVKKGELIAEIDPTLFESRVGQTSAQIGNSQAQLADRRAQLQLAEQRVERNRRLVGSDAVSRQELESSEAVLQQAQAGVRAIEAQIRQQDAALVFDRTNLRYTKIYAPMDGTVVSITARQGQTLVAAQQAPVILRIADLGTMTVQAQVSEADISRIKEGTPASFNTLGLPDRRWTGTVRQILPTPETVNNVVLFNVLFDVVNPDGVLLPQMSAQVSFLLDEVKDAIVIPARALLPKGPRKKGGGKDAGGNDSGKSAAGVKPDSGGKPGGADASGGAALAGRKARVEVLEGGKPVERKVTVGLETRNEVQVLEGLREGEMLVLPPQKSEGGRGGKGGKGGSGGSSGGGMPKVRPH